MGETTNEMDSLNSESNGSSPGKVDLVEAVNCQKQRGHGDS